MHDTARRGDHRAQLLEETLEVLDVRIIDKTDDGLAGQAFAILAKVQVRLTPHLQNAPHTVDQDGNVPNLSLCKPQPEKIGELSRQMVNPASNTAPGNRLQRALI